MSPFSMYKIISASLMVASRCAMTKLVLPCISLAKGLLSIFAGVWHAGPPIFRAFQFFSSSVQFYDRSRLPCSCRPERRKQNTCEPASVSCSLCRSILPCRQVLRVTNIYVLSLCVSSYILGFLRGDVPRIFLCLDVLLLLTTRFIWNSHFQLSRS